LTGHVTVLERYFECQLKLSDLLAVLQIHIEFSLTLPDYLAHRINEAEELALKIAVDKA